ncbi:MAG: hypothetical protein ACXW3P_08590, partial [Rhodospirillales bacterium]
MLAEPAGGIEIVELRIPQHSGAGMAHDRRFVPGPAGSASRQERGVEGVGFGPARRHDRIEADERTAGPIRGRRRAVGEAQAQLAALAGLENEIVADRGLG